MSTLQVDRIIPYQSSSVLVEGLSAPNLATTGSNTFVGDQDIQGTITASIQEGFALVGGVGDVSTLVATSSFGTALDTSSLATTGSNTFTGNQTITGSLTISGSDNFDLVVQGKQSIIGPTTGQTPQLIISSSDFTNTIGRGNIAIVGSGSFVPTISISGSSHRNTIGQRTLEIGKPTFDYPVFSYQYTAQSSSFLFNFTENLSATASYTVGVFDNAFTQDVELLLETTTTNGVQFKDIRSDNGAYTTFLKIAPNGGSNPPLEFKRSAQVTGSVDISGDITLNGSTAKLELTGVAGIIKANNITGSWGQTNPDVGTALKLDGSLDITGSVGISQVMTLAGQDPLPAGAVGQLAVSASNLYYNNGATWTQIN